MRHTRSQCACCQQVIAGTKAFDAHRVGPYTRKQQRRRCLTSREMRQRGMAQNEQGWWTLPAHKPNREETLDTIYRGLM